METRTVMVANSSCNVFPNSGTDLPKQAFLLLVKATQYQPMASRQP
jgi:hypothetical protein